MVRNRLRNVLNAIAVRIPALKPAIRNTPPSSGTSGRPGLCMSLLTSLALRMRGIAIRKPRKVTTRDMTNTTTARNTEISVAPYQYLAIAAVTSGRSRGAGSGNHLQKSPCENRR